LLKVDCRVIRYNSQEMKVVLIPVILYLVACAIPALEWSNSAKPNDVMLGLRAFAVGWSGILAGVLAWYANPFWLLGIILAAFRKPMWTLAPGLIAIAISATIFSDIGRELPGDEGGVTKTAIIKLLPGCYVWMASLVTLPLAALIQKLRT